MIKSKKNFKGLMILFNLTILLIFTLGLEVSALEKVSLDKSSNEFRIIAKDDKRGLFRKPIIVPDGPNLAYVEMEAFIYML